ncbi:MAG: hypothetical protein SPL28_06705 [Bacteroidales bacterium]|nr:hypothetical protein [Bacteroidales bacterium]
MKKLFLMMMALGVMTLVSCNGNGNTSGSAAASGDKEQAAEVKGTVFEGDHFTFTYPEGFKETYKSGDNINVASEDNQVRIDATFSGNPCKPEDFKKYYDAMVGMEMFKDYKWEDAKIEDNIMTYKGVNGDNVENKYVVFLDETGGIAGTVKYPVAKAAEVEALIMPMLKSMKKK